MNLKKILVISLLGISILIPSISQAIAPPVYSVVPYGNNPFIFCTRGMPTDGWVAINPYAGTWTATRQYPNLYWVATYVAICPRGAPWNK